MLQVKLGLPNFGLAGDGKYLILKPVKAPKSRPKRPKNTCQAARFHGPLDPRARREGKGHRERERGKLIGGMFVK